MLAGISSFYVPWKALGDIGIYLFIYFLNGWKNSVGKPVGSGVIWEEGF